MSVQRLLATFVAGSILFYSAVHADEERDLDGMAVIGSEELPKALNIVPWRDAELGQTTAHVRHGLSDNPLEPLDREVFQRELQYHQSLSAPD
ncbi:hypothetical protein CAI21_02855 [Alkalilimnicola ehrlichii]|uniref:hypothetical protein n=1 Tax=Alkalilimnicola ehrlichii TaxID=351052 RepID=UPI000E2FA32D|nr:hypothetical protein [Alkalilimnicola ehrlichii]RFA30933.1 hypothetical protein CAI21_02855 [Alkalilimnicola ehrlichii]